MANYDKGDITDRERKASQNQTTISKQNVSDVKNQLARQLSNYDFADAQNRALADAQLKQISRKNSADRFEAQRDLQASTLGLLGAMGSAMNGSSTGNLMSMLRSRNDKDNNTYWSQLQENWDQVENAYDDSVNQNRVARRDAMQSAEKAIADINADWRANMNNINPNLFPKNGGTTGTTGTLSGMTASTSGDTTLGKNDVWSEKAAKQNNAAVSGYVLPDSTRNSIAANRNRVRGGDANKVGGDYFSKLMNRFNGR